MALLPSNWPKMQSSFGIFVIVLLSIVSSSTAAVFNATAGGSTFSLNLPDFFRLPQPEELKIQSSDFPSDFAFGVGTSAAQIEGSPKADGKGENVWENFAPKYQAFNNATMFPDGVDSYNRYLDDVKLVKDLGVRSYRFSIQWSRIFPSGSLSGGVNQKGVDHYNSLIDELIKNGIEPCVTISHFDLPQALLDKYGGYLNRSFVDDFKDYSDVLFKTFGDRVKRWITLNEPKIVALYGYENGWAPPGRCSVKGLVCVAAGDSSTEPYLVAHNLILAHAAAYRLYQEKYKASQGGEVGIALSVSFYEPLDPNSAEDKEAANRLLEFDLGWFAEPLVFGDYPKSMRDMVKERLPAFTEAEKASLKGSSDFLGINYYASFYGQNQPNLSVSPENLPHQVDAKASKIPDKNKMPLGGPSFNYPEGLQKLLEYMKTKYQNPTIYITENGACQFKDRPLPLDQLLDDGFKIAYILEHLTAINKAMKNGVNVKGYYLWTLMDDFEWGMGLVATYGLYYVDFNDNFKRIPRLSVKWYSSFLLQKS